MGQIYKIQEETLTGIADSIRKITGKTEPIKVEDISIEIETELSSPKLPELTNEGSASDLLSGKELIDQEGNKVIGTFTIDNELTTQSDLISEQDAKIAELAEILSNKAGGGSSGSSSTISVTIYDNRSFSGAYYFDENGMVQNVVLGTKTVNALNGIVFTRTPAETITASGNYVLSSSSSVNAVRFLEDGGTATVSK